jgi:hypothetical protein
LSFRWRVAGQSTTTKLGNSYVTRAGGQSFTTSQLGSSTITRDAKGNTWTTTQVGNSFVTRGSGGQQQTVLVTAQYERLRGIRVGRADRR